MRTRAGLMIVASLWPWLAAAGWADDPDRNDARAVDRQARAAEDLGRAIGNELDRSGSQILAPGTRVEIMRTRQDLSVTRRRLDTLKTGAPRTPSIPLLERQLDRAERAPRVGRGSAFGRDPIPSNRRSISPGGF